MFSNPLYRDDMDDQDFSDMVFNDPLWSTVPEAKRRAYANHRASARRQDQVVVADLTTLGWPDDIKQIGYYRSVSDLVHTNVPYPHLLSTLAVHLTRDYDKGLKDGIARALICKEARGTHIPRVLMDELLKETDPNEGLNSYRWVLIYALQTIGDASLADEVRPLLDDPRYESVRLDMTILYNKLSRKKATRKGKPKVEPTPVAGSPIQSLPEAAGSNEAPSGKVPRDLVKRRKRKDHPMTFEQKLAALAEYGLKLRDSVSMSALMEEWDEESLNEPGFKMALLCLGGALEEPPWTPYCDNLWHFDTECIEDEGSYTRIVERMVEMAQGGLPITNVQDHVDLEEEEAWVRFDCQRQTIQIDCKVDNDWVDTEIFGRFVELLKKYAPDKVYIYHHLDGQDCIIGCVTRDQFGRLQQWIPEVQTLA